MPGIGDVSAYESARRVRTARNLRVDGDGPPLVYVPGLDGTGKLFYTQVPSLAASYRVLTYRLRDRAPSWRVLVEDLAQVLDDGAPGAGPAIVVGESFGGALSMTFALAYPERVRALVILNSFPYFGPQYRLRLARWGIGAMPWGAMQAVRALTAWRLHSKHTHAKEMRRFLQLTSASTKTGYLNRLRLLESYDVRARLAELRMPVLYLAADEDHLIPSVAQARAMAARVPRATVRVLEGHGHSCFLARDLDLAAILAEWLPTVEGEGAVPHEAERDPPAPTSGAHQRG
jgi:pimeloyl-ACP methyl ester carboxylesterase